MAVLSAEGAGRGEAVFEWKEGADAATLQGQRPAQMSEADEARECVREGKRPACKMVPESGTEGLASEQMPGRVLIIEDNPPSLDLMLYLLKAFGYMVLSAVDGAEGLELTRRESPDLIICDIHLPKIDGYELAKKLKGNPALKHIPLVAVTALAMVGDRDKILAAGFDWYIDKPIDPQKFREQVGALLSGAR